MSLYLMVWWHVFCFKVLHYGTLHTNIVNKRKIANVRMNMRNFVELF